MISLNSIRDSFEGVIPSVIATTDPAGMPNISYLSHVYYVDERHVALSNQFFSKTAANVRSSGLATVMVVDGRSGAQHILDLTFRHSEENGELFERVASHLAVMSAKQGMANVMKLRSIDIYRVEDCRAIIPVAPLAEAPASSTSSPRLPLAANLANAVASQVDAEAMLDCALDGLHKQFAFPNVMILVPDDSGEKLTTIASRGYARFGIGSETPMGSGTIGIAASTRRPLRISDMRRGQRYASAVRAAFEAEDHTLRNPLPTLAEPLSQLAVPMLCRGRLTGVLFVESPNSFAFGHEDEDALLLVASQLAVGLTLSELERFDSRPPETTTESPTQAKHTSFAVRYFSADGSIFINNEYVIRGVPGRLLYTLLRQYLDTRRSSFTNREIRRDTSLGLPDFKDNLETRLILLRRRLEEKAGPVRICRPERGHIELVVEGLPTIELMT